MKVAILGTGPPDGYRCSGVTPPGIDTLGHGMDDSTTVFRTSRGFDESRFTCKAVSCFKWSNDLGENSPKGTTVTGVVANSGHKYTVQLAFGDLLPTL